MPKETSSSNPNELFNVSEKLRTLVNSTLTVTLPYEAPSRTKIGQLHLGTERKIIHKLPEQHRHIFDFYSNVVGWIEANPSKSELKEAIKSVFEWEEIEGIDNSNYVNTLEGHIAFKMEVSKANPYPVFLIAPKGAGKTFYLNYFLNNYTTDLYGSGIIWYRADLAKIYEHRIKVNTNFSIKNYLFVQIVYVTFKHRKSHKIFDDVWDSKNSVIQKILIKEWQNNKEYRNTHSSPDDILDELKVCINKLEDYVKEDNVTKNSIFIAAEENNLFLTCELLAKTILSYLEVNKFRALFILDSLDNVNYYKNIHLYNDMLDEISIYAFRDDKFIKANKYNLVLSMRDETYYHLRKRAKEHFNTNSPVEFRIKDHNLLNILSCKARVVKNADSEYFKSKKYFLIHEINKYMSELEKARQEKFPEYKLGFNTDNWLAEMVSEFCSESENYMIFITGAINASIADSGRSLAENDVFRVLYNKNLRAFLNNFVNVVLYKMLFKENMPYISSDRSYVAIEGQFLNGMLYLDSKNHMHLFGKFIPNIFYFNNGYNLEKWHGLCGLRILQFLRQPRTDEAVFIYMTKHFSYDSNVVKNIFYSLLSFGLHGANYNDDKNEVDYKITEKGEFVIAYIFSELNVFYNLALDTPLNTTYSDPAGNNQIEIHSNNPKMWENYLEGCIIASTVMARHILTIHAEEFVRLPTNDRFIFVLPKAFPNKLIATMQKYSNIIKSFKDTKRYDEFISKISGMV